MADLNVNPNNQIIAKFGRAFGKIAETVAAYDEAFIEAHHAAGLLTALKHFPGHGSSTADSHEGFVDITETWQRERTRALSGADRGWATWTWSWSGTSITPTMPMTAQQTAVEPVAAMDHGVLRDELGFDGVVISDDLEMGAIREHFDARADR